MLDLINWIKDGKYRIKTLQILSKKSLSKVIFWLTLEFNEVAEGDLGEERILLGKIAEGGRSEPLNSC